MFLFEPAQFFLLAGQAPLASKGLALASLSLFAPPSQQRGRKTEASSGLSAARALIGDETHGIQLELFGILLPCCQH
jgi:hypothetical protein